MILHITGQLFLAISFILATGFENLKKIVSKSIHTALLFYSTTILLWVIIIVLTSNISFPEFVYEERLISQPVELITSIIFFIAFFFVFKRFLEKKDTFSGMLIASILIKIYAIMYVSFSKKTI